MQLGDVRFVPKADLCRNKKALFDYLVGAGEHPAEISPSALAVLRLKLARYFVGACTGSLRAFRPLGCDRRTGRAPEHVDPIRPIGEQPAGGDEVAIEVDRGQLVPCCKRDDQIVIMRRRKARGHDQTTIRGLREGRDARSISPASRLLIGVTSTRSDGAIV